MKTRSSILRPFIFQVPRRITGEARKVWFDWAPAALELGTLNLRSLAAFEQLCLCYVKLTRMLTERRRAGYKAPPYAAYMRKLNRESEVSAKTLRGFKRFGLMPGARARILRRRARAEARRGINPQ